MSGGEKRLSGKSGSLSHRSDGAADDGIPEEYALLPEVFRGWLLKEELAAPFGRLFRAEAKADIGTGEDAPSAMIWAVFFEEKGRKTADAGLPAFLETVEAFLGLKGESVILSIDELKTVEMQDGVLACLRLEAARPLDVWLEEHTMTESLERRMEEDLREAAGLLELSQMPRREEIWVSAHGHFMAGPGLSRAERKTSAAGGESAERVLFRAGKKKAASGGQSTERDVLRTERKTSAAGGESAERDLPHGGKSARSGGAELAGRGVSSARKLRLWGLPVLAGIGVAAAVLIRAALPDVREAAQPEDRSETAMYTENETAALREPVYPEAPPVHDVGASLLLNGHLYELGSTAGLQEMWFRFRRLPGLVNYHIRVSGAGAWAVYEDGNLNRMLMNGTDTETEQVFLLDMTEYAWIWVGDFRETEPLRICVDNGGLGAEQ